MFLQFPQVSFLTYQEKFLAGSWRFLTYFGRDTLISLNLFMDVLTPSATEAAIGSVLERLNTNASTVQGGYGMQGLGCTLKVCMILLVPNNTTMMLTITVCIESILYA